VETLEDLVTRDGQELFRLAYLLSGNHHAAEDLYQETMVKAHKQWRRVAAAGRPTAYVRRIMLNTFTSTRRKRQSSEVVADLSSWDGEPVSADLESRVIQREAMWRLLQGLPAAERAALVLRYYEDLTDRESAKLLGCRPSTVRATTSRALARLRTAHTAEGSVSP
jgi:RNA polymerase sigma-70 factor (sigma-E family)